MTAAAGLDVGLGVDAVVVVVVDAAGPVLSSAKCFLKNDKASLSSGSHVLCRNKT